MSQLDGTCGRPLLSMRPYLRGEDKIQHQYLAKLRVIAGMVFGGCIHRRMSRPYTIAGKTCRICTSCGARRRFDVERWAMYGPYYW